MPHIRFNRDRRGYENTFLVHRDRSQPGEKGVVLYWFRTPPDIRVGRTALDDEAIRRLERAYPGVRFDWAQLLAKAAEVASGARTERPAPNGQKEPQWGNRRRNRRRSVPPTPGAA